MSRGHGEKPHHTIEPIISDYAVNRKKRALMTREDRKLYKKRGKRKKDKRPLPKGALNK